MLGNWMTGQKMILLLVNLKRFKNEIEMFDRMQWVMFLVSLIRVRTNICYKIVSAIFKIVKKLKNKQKLAKDNFSSRHHISVIYVYAKISLQWKHNPFLS
jgi:hypothetical protein